MRPKLRGDCLYFEIDDGAYLETPQSSLMFSGATTFRLLDRIAPYLDGSHTMDELVDGLTEAQRVAITDLVTELARGGMVRDAADDRPHQLSADQVERWADLIAMLDAAAGSGGYRFERFRAGRVLVLGDGALVPAVLAGLWRIGLRCPEVIIAEPDSPDRITADRITAELALARAADPEADLKIVHTGQSFAQARLDGLIGGYDTVLHCATRPLLGQVARLSRAAARVGVPVVHTVVVDGSAWIGPLYDVTAQPPMGGGCFECGWLRLLGTMSHSEPGWPVHQLVDHPDAAAEQFLSGPLTDLVATTAAFGYFRAVTGSGIKDADPRLVRITLRTAESAEHPFQPHPRCPSHPGEAVTWQDLPAVADWPDTASEPDPAAVDLAGEGQLGVLLSVDAGAHRQLPLRVVEAGVADVAATGHGPTTVVVGADSDELARRHGVLLAAETVIERVLVDAAQAGSVAVAGGQTWAQALGRALLRHCHRITVAGAPDAAAVGLAGDAAGELSQAALTLDPGLRVAVLADGEDGFATVAVHSGDGVLATASALTREAALRTALEVAVLRLQGEALPAPDIAVQAGDPLWAQRGPLLAGFLARAGRVTVAQPLVDRALTRFAGHFAALSLVATDQPAAGQPEDALVEVGQR